MASVTKRGKKWSLRYRVTDERGVVTHHRVSFDTKEEAWENARRLESASEAGVNVHGDQMTCGQLMENGMPSTLSLSRSAPKNGIQRVLTCFLKHSSTIQR